MTQDRNHIGLKKVNPAKLELQVFTILASLYYILNVIFPTDYSLDAENPDRIYPQMVMAMMAALSVGIFSFSIKRIWRNPVMRGFLILLSLALIYVFYPLTPVTNLIYVSRTYMAVIVMFALYVLLLRIKDIRYWMKRVYVIYGFQIAFSIATLIMDKVGFSGGVTGHFDSNAGFFLITCIPLALTIPVKRARLYVYCLLVLACIYSGQRSAALAAVASFPFCLSYLRPCVRKSDLLILLVLGSIVALPVLVDALQNIHERNMYDIEHDDLGSGRLVFWGIVLVDYASHGIVNLLVGNGTNSVAPLLERMYGIAIGAHNGWLDILYTFGAVGVLIYGFIQFRFIFRNKRISRMVPVMRNMYLIIFIIFFVKSVTSHGYFDTDTIPFLTAVALVEGLADKKRIRMAAQKRSEKTVTQ